MRAYVYALSLLATASVRAEVIDPAFVQTNVVTIPNDPRVTSMAWAPDGSGRLFVTGKNGHIWIVDDGVVLPDTAYRFVPRADEPTGELVTAGDEAGLAGIAFDPAFADNGYVYIIATLYVPATSTSIEQQIIRFTMQGNTATERTTLVAGLPSKGGIHNGGGLAFGPDGLLYWAIGDNGASVGLDEDLESPGSKISRASSVLGAPPPPGPFNDGAGPNYDYIFARGARNPFTMTFHPITGVLWVNIVGDAWEQIFAVAAGDHLGYPMENVAAGAGMATTTAIVAYRTQATSDLAIGADRAVRANNIVTMRTGGFHRLHKGATITISDIDDASFDGVFAISSVPSPLSFTYAQTGPDASSGNGTARPDDYGQVVLGGAFYDATLFPPAFRQNFFFGDFASEQLVRVETAADTTVSRVSAFGTGMGAHIDTSTGPDGALWLVDHAGTLRRITYAATTQGIVVSPQNLRLSETSRGFIGVRLAIAPATDVTITLARASGSTFVSVPTAALTFTPANWDQPQYVEVTSELDADTIEDVAMFEAMSTGIPTEVVTVRVTDTREPEAPAIDAPPLDTDGPTMTSSGCCTAGPPARGSLSLALLVGWLALRRRRT